MTTTTTTTDHTTTGDHTMTTTSTATDRVALQRQRRADREATDRAALAILTGARRGARGAGADPASDADDYAATATLKALTTGANVGAAVLMARQARTNAARAAVARSERERAAALGLTEHPGWHGAHTTTTALASEPVATTTTTRGVVMRGRCQCGRAVTPTTTEHTTPRGRTYTRPGWWHDAEHPVELVPGSVHVVAILSTPDESTPDTMTPRAAAYRHDGKVERPDRDTARKLDMVTGAGWANVVGNVTGHETEVPDTMNHPGATGRNGETTRGDRSWNGKGTVREAREATVADMLHRWTEMGAAGADHSRPDETDRYGARRFWATFTAALADDRTPGKYAAAIRGAVVTANEIGTDRASLDGESWRPVTLSDYVAAAYRVTSPRRQSREGDVVTSTDTTEHGEIGWGEILSALPGVTVTRENGRQYRRALVAMVRTAALDTMTSTARYGDGADRDTARERSGAVAPGGVTRAVAWHPRSEVPTTTTAGWSFGSVGSGL